MSDAEEIRDLITRTVNRSRPASDLAALTELGAVHYTVLEMLADSIRRLHDAGVSKAEIHRALSEEVVLARFDRDHSSDPDPSS